jgi:hypothetical protein
VGIVSIGLIARQWRAWLPLAAATALFVVAMVLPGFLPRAARPAPSTAVEESVTASAASATPALSAAPVASESGPSAGIPAGSGPPLESRLPILNAGFELGAINNGTIYGWSKRPGLTSAPDGTASYNIVEGGAYRGARFASIRNVLKPFQATVTSSRIPFTVGDDIGVSVWVKAIVGRPVLAIYINWFDASGRLISSDRAGSLSTKGALTWQECVGFAKPPAGTAQAQLLLYEGTTTTTMGIDEVTVQRGDFLPEPTPPKGRPATLQQIIDNLLSIFSASPDSGLEGSKQFRLAWWGKIIDYTVFGNYFWTGKGFGVNLADTDGFQSTVDRSLRSPHNSHVTVLARMGIPGFVLWLVLQGTFGIGLLRATIALRRAGDVRLAMTAALVFSYWVAIMVDTSFDPYLEGPQGGIWFWTIFGVGLVIMSIAPRRPVTA